MNAELGDGVEFESQNEKLTTHLQKLIYTSTHDTRAEHIIFKKITWTLVLSSNNIKKLLTILLLSVKEDLL